MRCNITYHHINRARDMKDCEANAEASRSIVAEAKSGIARWFSPSAQGQKFKDFII